MSSCHLYFCGEIGCHSDCHSFEEEMNFLFDCFKDFPFGVCSFTIIWLAVNLFLLIVLGIHWHPFWKFIAIISLSIVFPLFSLFCCLVLLIYQCLASWSPNVSPTVFIFSVIAELQVISFNTVFKLLTLFLAVSNLLLTHPESNN